jgi:hypothetical protein
MLVTAFRLALGVFTSGNGFLVAVSAALLTFVAYTNLIKHNAAKTAVTEIVQKATDDAKTAENKSDQARVDAGKPGAVDRLRRDPKSCPDCIKASNGKPVQKLATSDNQKR